MRKKRVIEQPTDALAAEEVQATAVEVEAFVDLPEVEEQAESPIVSEIIDAPVEPEAIVEPVDVEITESAEPVVVKTINRKDLLGADEIALREQEAKRHSTLAAMQAEDRRKKQELAQRRLDEEAKKLAEAELAKAKAAKLSEGTLHKPVAKEGGVKPATTKEAKKGKGNNKEWTDAENKKRGLKDQG